MLRSIARALALIPLLLPGLARAGDAPQSPIWNGTPAGVCDWPSVVQMDDSCTGTLVHPQVVIYAGHCGPDYANIHFGEDGSNPAFSAVLEFCVSSGFDTGHDYSVCKLETPVDNVPLVPILMGCETDILQVGRQVTMIGFGDAEPPLEYGIKRVAHSTIQEFADNEVFIQSDDMMDTCFGDSGGPVMIQLDDGTWRVFGITSYGVSEDCGTGTWYSMMHTDLQWFEDQVGIDITPCHTADGTWDPGPACGGFPKDPGTGVGAWNACGPGPVGPLSATCGPAFDTEDAEPPLAEVVAPETGVEFMAVDKLPLQITGAARDAADKPDGWGIAETRLVLNDNEIGDSERTVAPYNWNVQLPSGQYVIQILAVDHAGNEALSDKVAIGVNMPPPELMPPGDDTTGGDAGSSDDGDVPTDPGPDPDTTDATSDDASTTDPGADDDEGCGCATTSSPALFGHFALPLVLLARRRRRRR